MLKSITLQNFKSFGEKQTIALGPLTVLVGPNNSGKSAFMSIGRLIGKVTSGIAFADAVDSEGGIQSLLHRPVAGDGAMIIAWATDQGAYQTELALDGVSLKALKEELTYQNQAAWISTDKLHEFPDGHGSHAAAPFSGLDYLMSKRLDARNVALPLVSSRVIRLSPERLREEALPENPPQLRASGAGLAQVVSAWRESKPKLASRLDEFVKSGMPEVEAVLVRSVPFPRPGSGQTVPSPGAKELLIEQRDGEQFPAASLSDGLLCFIALAVNAIAAGPGAVLFVEEPEQFMHPTLIHSIVDLLRRVAWESKCQVVLSTHSPLVLNEFRDTPEDVKLFRRSESGTRVRNLSEFPALLDDLGQADLGSLFAAGFFNSRFEQLDQEQHPEGQGA